MGPSKTLWPHGRTGAYSAFVGVVVGLTVGCNTVELPAPPQGPALETDDPPLVDDEPTSAKPTEPADNAAVSITASLYNTCAAGADGHIYCFGSRIDAISGPASVQVHPPGRFGRAAGVLRVRANRDKLCARFSEGFLGCEAFGPQVANAPLGYAKVRGIEEFAVGVRHQCGVAEGAIVRCAGDNGDRQRGHNNRYFPPAHNDIEDLSDVQQVAAGLNYTCARTPEEVVCFGSNEYGQLGDGTTERRWRHAPVTELTDAIDIDAHFAGTLTCALRQTGAVVCWGAFGTGRPGIDRKLVGHTPVVLPPVDGLRSISVGIFEVCGIDGSGAVHCWAESLDSARGQPEVPVFAEANRVEGLTDVAELAMGMTHTCARTTDGHIACWGMNDYGQLGDGTRQPQPHPVWLQLPRSP